VKPSKALQDGITAFESGEMHLLCPVHILGSSCRSLSDEMDIDLQW
jgi:hypothetical protein